MKSGPQPQTYLEALMRGSGTFSPIMYNQAPRPNDEPVDSNYGSPAAISADISVGDDLVSSEAASSSHLRKRSVSFSLEASNHHISPLRAREHCSEAGSPTFEQVLLMSQRSPIQVDCGQSSTKDGALSSVANPLSNTYANSYLSSSYCIVSRRLTIIEADLLRSPDSNAVSVLPLGPVRSANCC